MPYSIDWEVDGRVVYERVYGDITVEELVRFNHDVSHLITNNGRPPVHIIMDLSEIGHYPYNLKDLIVVRQSDDDQVGLTLVITQNPKVRFMASTLGQFAGPRLRVFNTEQETLEFLTREDKTLHLQ